MPSVDETFEYITVLYSIPRTADIARLCICIARLRIQYYIRLDIERTGSGLLLRSTRESETRILPSRTTVCSTSPYFAMTFSFLSTPRDTTASCNISVSSTGLPKFHVKLWIKTRDELLRACILKNISLDFY